MRLPPILAHIGSQSLEKFHRFCDIRFSTSRLVGWASQSEFSVHLSDLTFSPVNAALLIGTSHSATPMKRLCPHLPAKAFKQNSMFMGTTNERTIPMHSQ